MHRDRLGHVALVALLLATAFVLPTVQGQAAHERGLPPTYTLSDAADDQAVQLDPLIGDFVGEGGFQDIDIRSVSFYETLQPPGGGARTFAVAISVGAPIEDGASFTVGFVVARGPTSLPGSTATAAGKSFNLTALPSAAGASVAVVEVPLASLGAVGGDLLTNLTVASSRFDPGQFDPVPISQDDRTGTDQAPDAGTVAPAYTFFRPASASLWSVDITAVGATAGSTATLPSDTEDTTVALTITNQGLDAEGYSLTVAADPPLDDPPVFTLELRILDGGESETRTVPISLAGVTGTVRLTFTVTGERGGSGDDLATVTLRAAAIPPTERQVVPAGLTFLTPAAEALGLDGAFGKFAELVLLALLVLLAILAIYLLLALAPSTVKAAATDEAPPLPGDAPRTVGSEALPAGLLDDAAEPSPPAAPPVATKPTPAAEPAGLRIASVTHTPNQPEAGEEVRTEIVLRNAGPTRQVRVVLARDGADLDDALLTLPAFATKNVTLSWTAGEGDNRVKVRVLPA